MRVILTSDECAKHNFCSCPRQCNLIELSCETCMMGSWHETHVLYFPQGQTGMTSSSLLVLVRSMFILVVCYISLSFSIRSRMSLACNILRRKCLGNLFLLLGIRVVCKWSWLTMSISSLSFKDVLHLYSVTLSGFQ